MTTPPKNETTAALPPVRDNNGAVPRDVLTSDAGIKVWLEDPGIMRVKLPQGANVAGRHAAAAAELVHTIARGSQYPLLLDLSGVMSVSRTAREVYGQPMTVTAYALLGQGPVDRVLAHYFTGAAPSVPMQFFLSEAEAIRWLGGFCNAG